MYKSVLYLVLIISGFLNAQNFWQKMGNPMSGTVNSITFNTAGNIFVGAPGSGIYRSTDNGNNWVPVNNGLLNLRITSLAANAKGDIFAGTDPVMTTGGGAAFIGGIFRSTDNGESWNKINNGLTDTVIKVIMVSKKGNIFAGTYYNKVFCSTDNGDNWSEVFSSSTVLSLTADTSGSIFAGTGNGQLYISNDEGKTWVQKNVTNYSLMALNSNGKGNIIAGTNGNGVFRSTDNGNTWVGKLAGMNVRAVSSNSNGKLYAATSDSGVYCSTDDGENWTKTNDGISGKIYNFGISPSGKLFSLTEAFGIYSSEDGGISWTQSNNGLTLNMEYISSIVIDRDGYFLSATSSGIYRSKDKGNKWLRVGYGKLDEPIQFLSVNSKGDIFAGSINGVVRSLDNGVNWTRLTLYNNWAYTLAINSLGHIYVGTVGGVFCSTDNGNNWKSISNALVHAIGFTSKGTILLGSTLRSTDWGSSWFETVSPSTSMFFAMAVSDNDYIYAGTSNDIYRSIDGGNNWVKMDSLLINLRTLAADSKGNIFGGTSSKGIYSSSNYGAVWNRDSSINSVSSFYFDADGYVYAGTNLGFLRSVNPVMAVNENKSLAKDYSLSQNYPNPFNPSTTIKYTVGSHQFVSLKVFDVLGNEVSTLVNEEKSAGNYSVDFNASHLSSGVYFYTLKAGSFVESKKMIFLK